MTRNLNPTATSKKSATHFVPAEGGFKGLGLKGSHQSRDFVHNVLFLEAVGFHLA